jgi:hypothetical protein
VAAEFTRMVSSTSIAAIPGSNLLPEVGLDLKVMFVIDVIELEDK